MFLKISCFACVAVIFCGVGIGIGYADDNGASVETPKTRIVYGEVVLIDYEKRELALKAEEEKDNPAVTSEKSVTYVIKVPEDFEIAGELNSTLGLKQIVIGDFLEVEFAEGDENVAVDIYSEKMGPDFEIPRTAVPKNPNSRY